METEQVDSLRIKKLHTLIRKMKIELAEKNRVLYNQSVVISDDKKTLFELRTSLRWKISNFIYKFYKNNLEIGILKFIFKKINLVIDFFEKINLKRKASRTGKISIIIPVYNGYIYFKECFESLLKSTSPEDFMILIINDFSDEKELIEYFNEIKKRNHKNVVFIDNSKNIGFIKSVNIGMKYSESADVILLNSDTVLTKNWFKKMKAAAYSRNNIGTVTPISNKASLVSFPNQWEDNEIPKGQTLESLSNIIEKSSLRVYPEIPTPVGFCLYIKRDLIKKIGYFDEIYGKGYGEEADFGTLARRTGYHNILDDSTFIEHKGSMTFGNSENKKKDYEKNLQILHDKYPELNGMLIRFNAEEHLSSIYSRIKLNIEKNLLEKKGLLFVTTDDVSNNFSGALMHVKNLIENVDGNFSKYVLYIKEKTLHLTLNTKTCGLAKFRFDFKIDFDPITDFRHQKIEEIFKRILNKFNISIVHFQTPQNLPLSLVELAKKNVDKVFFTAHDYLFYCPNFTLIQIIENKKKFFCGFEKEWKKCKDCLRCSVGARIYPDNFNEARRNFICDKVFPHIDTIFFPSDNLKKNIEKIMPCQSEVVSDGIVLPHGINDLVLNKKTRKDENLNIAHIGLFSYIKGSEVFASIVNHFKNNENIHFFIIGRIDDEGAAEEIEKFSNVHIIGAYSNNNELSLMLKKYSIDLTFLFSIWPEAFSYTLSESWQNGIPAISFDFGAQGDRIKQTGAGWTFDAEKYLKETIDLIEKIQTDKNLLKEKSRLIPRQKGEVENAKEYEEFYTKKA